ncbi:MAG: hypothetical protein COY47_06710, partial [Chloroflexi bacterium CG_4_10_14_0_8_um_filter_57_5]
QLVMRSIQELEVNQWFDALKGCEFVGVAIQVAEVGDGAEWLQRVQLATRDVKSDQTRELGFCRECDETEMDVARDI